MFKWKFFVGVYGKGWWTPFFHVAHEGEKWAFQVVVLRWSFSLARVATEAYWEDLFAAQEGQG